MSSFNFKEYMKKQASYEGAQGYFSAQSRAWCNCFRDKLRSSKKPQESWLACLEEYGKSAGNSEWALKYASAMAKSLYKEAEEKDNKSYRDLIHNNLKSGLSVKASIFKAMDEFFGPKAKMAQAEPRYELVQIVSQEAGKDKVLEDGSIESVLEALDKISEQETITGTYEVWDKSTTTLIARGTPFFCASEIRKSL